VYGPAPIGSVASVAGFASDAGAMMSPPMIWSDKTTGMSGFGFTQVICTCISDSAVTLSQPASHCCPFEPDS
jgi:hypothetical protein